MTLPGRPQSHVRRRKPARSLAIPLSHTCQGPAARTRRVGHRIVLMPQERATATPVTFRRARPADVPRFVELIAGASLPPLFVEEYLDGFIAGEADGRVVACGGLEIYGDCGVIRSVVVDESARGAGAGKQIAEMLIEDARRAGARDLYLFTGDAHDFWLRFGFADVTFDDWRAPARMCWQYQFLSRNRDLGFEVHTMWRRA